MFGLSVWVFQETGSATAYSTLIFFAIIPSAIGALFSGPYVDRWNRRQVLIWSDVIASLSTLGILLLFYTNMLQQWQLYIALSINGLANAFFLPAFNASVPLLVPSEYLSRASGLAQMSGALIPIIAPALAGVLMTGLGLGAIFIADFITFLLGILSLRVVLIPQPATSKDVADYSFLGDLVFGLRYVWRHRSLVYLMAFMALFTFLNGVLAALMGPLVMSFAGAQMFGVVYAGLGAGALISGGLLSIWGGPRRRMSGILMGTVVAGVGATIAGIWADVVVITAGIFLFGTGFMFLSALSYVIYQAKVAPGVLGRIFALSTVSALAAQSISVLGAGPLATHIFEPLLVESGSLADSMGRLIGVGPGRGIGLIYVSVGAIILLLALVATVTPGIRLLEDDLPDFVQEGLN